MMMKRPDAEAAPATPLPPPHNATTATAPPAATSSPHRSNTKHAPPRQLRPSVVNGSYWVAAMLLMTQVMAPSSTSLSRRDGVGMRATAFSEPCFDHLSAFVTLPTVGGGLSEHQQEAQEGDEDEGADLDCGLEIEAVEDHKEDIMRQAHSGRPLSKAQQRRLLREQRQQQHRPNTATATSSSSLAAQPAPAASTDRSSILSRLSGAASSSKAAPLSTSAPATAVGATSSPSPRTAQQQQQRVRRHAPYTTPAAPTASARPKTDENTNTVLLAKCDSASGYIPAIASASCSSGDEAPLTVPAPSTRARVAAAAAAPVAAALVLSPSSTTSTTSAVANRSAFISTQPLWGFVAAFLPFAEIGPLIQLSRAARHAALSVVQHPFGMSGPFFVRWVNEFARPIQLPPNAPPQPFMWRCVNCSMYTYDSHQYCSTCFSRIEKSACRLFIGQLRKEQSADCVRRMLRHLCPAVEVLHVESHNNKSGNEKGCAWLYLNTLEDCESVRQLHKRVYFDIDGNANEGFWFGAAGSDDEMLAFAGRRKDDAARLNTVLPRQPLVAEYPESSLARSIVQATFSAAYCATTTTTASASSRYATSSSSAQQGIAADVWVPTSRGWFQHNSSA